MTEPRIFTASVWEGTDNCNVGRIVLHNRNPMVRSDFSTWELQVYDLDDLAEVYSLTAQPNTNTATFYFHDTLQENGYWGIDDKGYNFLHHVTDAAVGPGVLKGGRTYAFEYGFNTTLFGRIPVTFHWRVEPTVSQ